MDPAGGGELVGPASPTAPLASPALRGGGGNVFREAVFLLVLKII